MECVKHAGTEMRLLLGTKVCDACEATSQFERGYRCVGCGIDYALDGVTPLREFEAAEAQSVKQLERAKPRRLRVASASAVGVPDANE